MRVCVWVCGGVCAYGYVYVRMFVLCAFGCLFGSDFTVSFWRVGPEGDQGYGPLFPSLTRPFLLSHPHPSTLTHPFIHPFRLTSNQSPTHPSPTTQPLHPPSTAPAPRTSSGSDASLFSYPVFLFLLSEGTSSVRGCRAWLSLAYRPLTRTRYPWLSCLFASLLRTASSRHLGHAPALVLSASRMVVTALLDFMHLSSCTG
jgi:hypothetical protein